MVLTYIVGDDDGDGDDDDCYVAMPCRAVSCHVVSCHYRVASSHIVFNLDR